MYPQYVHCSLRQKRIQIPILRFRDKKASELRSWYCRQQKQINLTKTLVRKKCREVLFIGDGRSVLLKTKVLKYVVDDLVGKKNCCTPQKKLKVGNLKSKNTRNERNGWTKNFPQRVVGGFYCRQTRKFWKEAKRWNSSLKDGANIKQSPSYLEHGLQCQESPSDAPEAGLRTATIICIDPSHAPCHQNRK